jgi:hypothetical protein
MLSVPKKTRTKIVVPDRIGKEWTERTAANDLARDELSSAAASYNRGVYSTPTIQSNLTIHTRSLPTSVVSPTWPLKRPTSLFHTPFSF